MSYFEELITWYWWNVGDKDNNLEDYHLLKHYDIDL